MLDRPATRFVEIRESISFEPDASRFEYRADLGWKWLQRLCFKALRWVGAYHLEKIKTFTRTPRENDELLKSLLRQESQWIDRMHHGHERPHIYIGPDENMDLMKLMHHMGMRPVTFVGRIDTCDQYGRKWHDIPITVVPWMTGVLMVPR